MNELSQIYWRRARRAAWILQIVPYVRMIGANGSLTLGNLKASSDIDFFVITKYGRIWTCRFLVTVVTHFIGLRRHATKVAGRICLNQYQTDRSLEILPRNAHHAKLFSTLIPILDVDSLYPKYLEANRWMVGFNHLSPKGSFQLKKVSHSFVHNSFLAKIRKVGEAILDTSLGDWIENKLRDWQKRRILNDIRTKTAPEGKVRVSDEELCFHPIKQKSRS